MKSTPGALMPILQKAQEIYGYLPREVQIMGFPVCEITASCRAELLTGEHPELAGVQFIRDSDAHYLEQLGAAGQVLDLPEPTAGALVDYFLSFM